MKFEKVWEAKEWFRQYRIIEDTGEVPWFCYHSPVADKLKMGDWFMFQYMKHEKKGEVKVSRPILGMFIQYSIWDMATVVNLIEPATRAFHGSLMIGKHDEENNGYPYILMDAEVECFDNWHNNFHVLGHWTHKPSKQEIKQAILKQL